LESESSEEEETDEEEKEGGKTEGTGRIGVVVCTRKGSERQWNHGRFSERREKGYQREHRKRRRPLATREESEEGKPFARWGRLGRAT
jgi:hypothetical protein